jgi:hypothetical protein
MNATLTTLITYSYSPRGRMELLNFLNNFCLSFFLSFFLLSLSLVVNIAKIFSIVAIKFYTFFFSDIRGLKQSLVIKNSFSRLFLFGSDGKRKIFPTFYFITISLYLVCIVCSAKYYSALKDVRG